MALSQLPGSREDYPFSHFGMYQGTNLGEAEKLRFVAFDGSEEINLFQCLGSKKFDLLRLIKEKKEISHLKVWFTEHHQKLTESCSLEERGGKEAMVLIEEWGWENLTADDYQVPLWRRRIFSGRLSELIRPQ